MTLVHIRSSTLVEVEDANGEVVAKAVRAHVNQDWIIGGVHDGKMIPLGIIHSFVPELLGRKLVVALMKEFVVDDEE